MRTQQPVAAGLPAGLSGPLGKAGQDSRAPGPGPRTTAPRLLHLVQSGQSRKPRRKETRPTSVFRDPGDCGCTLLPAWRRPQVFTFTGMTAFLLSFTEYLLSTAHGCHGLRQASAIHTGKCSVVNTASRGQRGLGLPLRHRISEGKETGTPGHGGGLAERDGLARTQRQSKGEGRAPQGRHRKVGVWLCWAWGLAVLGLGLW